MPDQYWAKNEQICPSEDIGCVQKINITYSFIIILLIFFHNSSCYKNWWSPRYFCEEWLICRDHLFCHWYFNLKSNLVRKETLKRFLWSVFFFNLYNPARDKLLFYGRWQSCKCLLTIQWRFWHLPSWIYLRFNWVIKGKGFIERWVKQCILTK